MLKILERDIEAYLVKECKTAGILCEKFTSPQRRSVPDRILAYRGQIVFLELKATGKKPTDAQSRDHEKRNKHGVTTCWTDSKEGVDKVVNALLSQNKLALGYL